MNATTLTTPRTTTESVILEALPRHLVRILIGPAVLTELQGAWTYERACLLAAHDALGDEAPELGAALGHVSAGLAQAIRPEGVAERPETVLLQVAYWLLAHQQQAAELIGRAGAASASQEGGAA